MLPEPSQYSEIIKFVAQAETPAIIVWVPPSVAVPNSVVPAPNVNIAVVIAFALIVFPTVAVPGKSQVINIYPAPILIVCAVKLRKVFAPAAPGFVNVLNTTSVAELKVASVEYQHLMFVTSAAIYEPAVVTSTPVNEAFALVTVNEILFKTTFVVFWATLAAVTWVPLSAKVTVGVPVTEPATVNDVPSVSPPPVIVTVPE